MFNDHTNSTSEWLLWKYVWCLNVDRNLINQFAYWIILDVTRKEFMNHANTSETRQTTVEHKQFAESQSLSVCDLWNIMIGHHEGNLVWISYTLQACFILVIQVVGSSCSFGGSRTFWICTSIRWPWNCFSATTKCTYLPKYASCSWLRRLILLCEQ